MLLFTEDLMRNIVLWTNQYAPARIAKRHLVGQWTDTTIEELYRFFGILIHMGIHHLPALHMYWMKRPNTLDVFVANAMSRNRFCLLLACVQFCDPAHKPDPTDLAAYRRRDRIYAVRALIDTLNRTSALYRPAGRELTIDESMARFKGRLGMLQYNPNKPIRRGIKVYALNDPKTDMRITALGHTLRHALFSPSFFLRGVHLPALSFCHSHP
jgi:hypothetical protein